MSVTDYHQLSEDPQLLVYKASAGSGKTFTLAVQYIRQLIEDPYSYRRILAVTFTNKATTEMKDRILSQLYGLANDDRSADGYMNVLAKLTGKSEGEIRKTAGIALRNIIHDYSRFRIETIDSFFQSVIRNLARELELGTNMAIELDQNGVLSEAVDAMIEKLDRISPVLQWLIEYIEERIAEDKRWNVSDEIKSFGKNIFNEVYVEKGKEVREKLADPAFISSYRKRLNSMKTEALEQMKGFCEHFMYILEENGLEVTDLARKESGIAGYFRKLGNGNIGDDIRNATVVKSLDNPEAWATKTSPKRDFIISLAESTLIPVLQDAERLRPLKSRIVNSCDLSLKYLNNLRLLAGIDSEVKEQNSEKNRFLLAETNALLHSLMAEGDASFVYEKIGSNIDIVMIDEFQDTSGMQWENFHLLLEECLSHNDGSLIVGDIKQSIYRWRNGDWKILAGLEHDRSFNVNVQPLETNWRSEANIIEFNNMIFVEACHILDERYRQETGNSCQQLLDAYSDVCQKTAKKDRKGYVSIGFIEGNEEKTYEEIMLEELAGEVERLITNEGVAINDIAILVRKNRNIPVIADYFDKNTPYRIVSDEAFRYDASRAICMLVDALRCLATPEDTVACARLALAFQKDVLGKDTDINHILLNGCENFLPAEFNLQRKELELMPLYELLEKLYIIFDISKIEKQEAYICAFYDAVNTYLQNNSSELSSFLTFWDESMHSKTIQSGEVSGIRILSIHKSKGLEYHTVLVPFCDWKMENETNSHLIWCEANKENNEENPDIFRELRITPVNYSNAMINSVFSESYLDEKLQLWVDSLNLLYVAFTRACKNLFVWGRKNARGTVSELLDEALANTCMTLDSGEEKNEEDEEDMRYEYGEICCSEEKTEEQKSNNILTVTPENVPIRLESIETEFEFRQSNKSAEFIKGDDDDEKGEYIKMGQLLHHLFASVNTAGDLPKAVERLALEGMLESTEQEEKVRKIAEKALAFPKVSEWYGGGWDLYNECSIIFCDENGNTVTRRPDRVMMKDGEVVIVDFKFGKEKPEYVSQVQEYMNLATEMGYNNVKGYIWYVYAGKLEEVKA